MKRSLFLFPRLSRAVRKGGVRDAMRAPGYSSPIPTTFTLWQGLTSCFGRCVVLRYRRRRGKQARISIKWDFVELRSEVKRISVVACWDGSRFRASTVA